jgi:hypothetical protein
MGVGWGKSEAGPLPLGGGGGGGGGRGGGGGGGGGGGEARYGPGQRKTYLPEVRQ